MISLSPAVSIIGLLVYVILISTVGTSHEGVHNDDNHDSHHHHHHRQRYHYSEDRYDIEGRYNQHRNYVRDSKLIYSHTFKMSATNIIHSSPVRLQPNVSDIKDQRRLSIHSNMNTSAKGTRSPNTSSYTSPLSSHVSSHLSQSCLPILSVSLNIDPHKYLNRLINRYAFNCVNLLIMIYHHHSYHVEDHDLSSSSSLLSC